MVGGSSLRNRFSTGGSTFQSPIRASSERAEMARVVLGLREMALPSAPLISGIRTTRSEATFDLQASRKPAS